MSRAALIPLAAAMLVGCTTDFDDDGWVEEEDCNDEAAEINPDATEIRGDGIDQDCDGEDLAHAYVGDWAMTAISAIYDGDDIFADLERTGSMVVTPDLETSIAVVFSYDGEQVLLDLSGAAVPGTDVGSFGLDLSGEYSNDEESYTVAADWDCLTSATDVSCSGPMTFDSYSMEGSASFAL